MSNQIMNRDSFLSTLHEKLGTTPQPAEAHPFIAKNNVAEATLADKTQDELLDIAKKRVTEINTTLLTLKNAELQAKIIELINQFGNGKVMLPADERFSAIGLEEFTTEKQNSEYTFTKYIWHKGSEYRNQNISEAAESNVAVAFADYLLAESGSVVVETSAGQGRTLHFLPTHYISIVPKSKIVARSTQAVAKITERQAKGEKLGSAIHFISGPSNSGDIEMQLVVGLHGPLEVYYLVVEDL